MKNLLRFATVLALFALAPAAPAATNIVDGVYTNLSGVGVALGDAFIARNGAIVSNTAVGMSAIGGTNGSAVIITGAGTVWSNFSTFYIGAANGRNHNRLTVNSNAVLFMSPSTFNVGDGENTFSNTVTVSDGGFINLNSGGKIDNGFDNGIVVSSGGRIRAGGQLTIGDNSSLLANAARASLLVTGAGSLIDGTGPLVVGNATRDASFALAQGGVVSNTIGQIGVSIMASNASAVVSDSGSRWINSGEIRVGQAGVNSSLLVTNSGYVKTANLYVGASPTGNLNRVTVTGSGALLDVASALRVGGSDATNPGGSSNSLSILNGGTVSNGNTTIGLTATSSNNQVVVSGSGSSWRMSGVLTVGDGGFGGSLVVSNGGVVRTLGNVVAGSTAGANGNQILVSGAGSVLDTAGAQLTVGVSGNSSSIKILGGGMVSNGGVVNAIGSGSMSNLGVVAGIDSRWIITNNGVLHVGQGVGSGFNKLFVTNGGLVNAALMVGSLGSLGSNEVYIGSGGIVSNSAGTLTMGASGYNKVTISDTGSVWSVGGLLYLGKGGNNNTVLVTNGGRLVTANAIYVPDTGGTNNLLRVVGAGSFVSAASGINFREGQFNRVEVLGGATMDNAGNLTFGGSGAAFSNNTFLASGPGTFVRFPQVLLPGSSNNAFLVTDGATVEINSLRMSMNGIISNSGGVFQFTAGNPVLTITSGAAMYLNNGTISWRARDDATPTITGNQFTNVQFSGNNSFQLNSASNATGLASYLVDSGSPSTTYQRLVLAGTNSAFRAGVLTIGSGGELYTSNSIGATIAALVTNSGTVKVFDSILTYQSNVVVNGGSFITRNATNQFNRGLSLAGNSTLTFTNGASRVTGVISNTAGSTIQAINSMVTFQDAVVIGGRYYSDPSTNTFVTNVTVTASGSLYGSNGDLFVFNRDLTMASTNRAQFDLSYAGVRFDTGAGTTNHILNLAGSGALDKGSNWIDHTQLTTNFSIGTLAIAAGNRLTLTGDKGSQTNALYVGWLDLTAWSTNALDLTNTLHAALSLDINLYYDKYDTKNAYLQGLEFDGWSGGGLLIPIPEPSVWMALGTGLALLAFLRRRAA